MVAPEARSTERGAERPTLRATQQQRHHDGEGHAVPVVAHWLKPVESMWTAVAVEPIAVRLAPVLARRTGITPNRITAVAACLGVASATSFALGALLLGGVLFQLRYVVDCLDGKVARLRGLSSTRGGAFDLMVDVLTITANYAALSSYVVRRGSAPSELAVAAVATSLLFAWMLAYRKGLEPAKGAPEDFPATTPAAPLPRRRAVAAYLDWMTRHRSMPVPYAVEAEILSLSLAPVAAALLGDANAIVVWCLWASAAFYACAVAVNARRIWRIAGVIDADRVRTDRSTHSG